MSSSKDTRPTNDDSSSGSESESEHPVNKKYRLRSRSKSMEEREEERKRILLTMMTLMKVIVNSVHLMKMKLLTKRNIRTSCFNYSHQSILKIN